jgi:hypothetical protein
VAGVTFDQIKRAACTGSNTRTMARYDWIQIAGVGTLVFTAGILCYLAFGMYARIRLAVSSTCRVFALSELSYQSPVRVR